MVLSVLENMKTGNGMQRGHCNATRESAFWYTPEVGFRKIVSQSISIKNDLRNHAIGPLGLKKRKKLLLGPLLVVMRIANGNKAGVPIPLMGIETWCGLRVGTRPVPIEDLLGLCDVSLETFG